ncbi:MAG: cytochrome c maturation protein CcmE [Firmicutes bacterium]|jgi:cytochrome c-type biogenesis protein CcmE|nr:cytochrome c maturation protein CcmE [Bacillota bacterium]
MADKKAKVIIVALLPVLVLGWLAFRAFENSAAYYYTISEVLVQEMRDQKLRIKGKLVKDSVNYDPSIPLLEFSLADQDSQVDAVYAGVLPDNFHHADEVIVEGKFNSRGQFTVSKLMLQCPSKYEGED